MEKLRGVWKIELPSIKVTTSTIQPERKGIIFVWSLKSVAGGTWFRVSNYLWQDTIIEFCHILETGWGWFYGQCLSIGPNIVICLISCRDVDLMTAWNTINAASNLALLNLAQQPELKSNKKAPPGAKYISQNDKLSLCRIKHKYLHKLFTITFCPFI